MTQTECVDPSIRPSIHRRVFTFSVLIRE